MKGIGIIPNPQMKFILKDLIPNFYTNFKNKKNILVIFNLFINQ